MIFKKFKVRKKKQKEKVGKKKKRVAVGQFIYWFWKRKNTLLEPYPNPNFEG